MRYVLNLLASLKPIDWLLVLAGFIVFVFIVGSIAHYIYVEYIASNQNLLGDGND